MPSTATDARLGSRSDNGPLPRAARRLRRDGADPAAEAILYVIGEVWAAVRRQGHAELGMFLLGFGFLLGVATDLVVA